MNLQNISLFQMAERKMNWLSQDQRVVAQNIANADTPKYIPGKLQEISFAKELGAAKGRMVVTNEKHRTVESPATRINTTTMNHITPPRAPETFRVNRNHRTYENSLDRNAVILEEQTLRSSEIRDEYDRVATLYQKYNTMIKSSLGKQ